MKKYTIAVATVCTLLLASCGNTPEKAVSDFYTANKANEFEKAMTFTDLPEEARPLVVAYLDSMGMVIHEFEVTGTTVGDGDTTALVDLHLVTSNAFYPDSIFDDIKVPCIKDGHTWKVHLNQ
jgi:outer membrane lipoprotein SlyB